MDLEQWLDLLETLASAWTLAPVDSLVEAEIDTALETCRATILEKYTR